MNVEKYLADLEARIDVNEEERIRNEWRKFLDVGSDEPVFSPVRKPVGNSAFEWPSVNINDAILDESFETMLLSQLCAVNSLVSSTLGNVPAIRANYGSNIMSTLFGSQLHMMERELNTLPGALPLPGGSDAVKKLIDQGVPDLNAGQLPQVFGAISFFIEKLNDYPKLKKYCAIYHPDFQGPLDICEVIYGSEIFLAFYDEPELMHDFLELITETYIKAMDRFFTMVKPAEDYNVHYGWMHKGKIRISLDSCVNFSGEMYQEFILPYDRKLFNRYGGIIHTCGKCDHFVPFLNQIGGGYNGFNLSQPHLNDMDKIFSETVDNGVRIFSLTKDAAQAAVSKGRNLRGLVHAV